MSNFTIREANTTDAPFIQKLLDQLEHPLTENEILEKINNYEQASYHLLIIEAKGTVVGFASLHWYDVFYDKGFVGRITAFCIHEQYRSKGFGKQLLQSAVSYLKEKGCIRIEVSSNQRRTEAHNFYLANGFIINSKRFIKIL